MASTIFVIDSSPAVRRMVEQISTPAGYDVVGFQDGPAALEAARKLRFTAKKTMVVAQQLYEGLPLGDEGSVGLITYMRTDSTHVATSALEETRSYIQSRYGERFLPAKARVFTKTVKGAQEAHEAIRPAGHPFDFPDSLRGRLSPAP